MKKTLCRPIREIEIAYVTTYRAYKSYKITTVGLEEGKTARGAFRLWLQAREEGEREIRTFNFGRIREITDLETGEYFLNPREWGEKVVKEEGGKQPSHWPFDYVRTTKIPWRLPTDHEKFSKDFYFGITKGHMAALDIRYEPSAKTERGTGAWTIGNPLKLSFQRGDLMHAPVLPEHLQHEPWGIQKKHLTNSVQVREVNWSNPDQQNMITFDLYDYPEMLVTSFTVGEREFVGYLKTGDQELLIEKSWRS